MSVKSLRCATGYIEIVERGRQGTKGDPGDLPGAGTTGQVLTKLSDASGDAGWTSPTFTGDASNINALDPLGNPSNVQAELDRTDANPNLDSLTVVGNADIGGNLDVDGTILEYIVKNEAPGDEGIDITGELHVGTMQNPKESVFGGGDSTVEGMVILNTPDGLTFNDLTNEASDTTTLFNMFGGVLTPGSAFYVGSDMPLKGIKVKTDNFLPVSTGFAVREYWNGAQWIEFQSCVTLADAPYTQLGRTIDVPNTDIQARFSDLVGQLPTNVDGNIKYWMRFRIITTLSNDLVLNQIKLHTNRFEVNADGNTEYFGDAIYERDLLMHWNLTTQLAGFSPSNENVNFASGISLQYTDNEFGASGTDGRAGYLVVPAGLDTSKPITFQFLWTPLGNGSGDVVPSIEVAQVKIGDTLDGSIVPEVFTQPVSISAGSDDVLQEFTIDIDVENLLPGEILVISFKRLGSDPLDTFSSSVSLVNVRAVGRFWRP